MVNSPHLATPKVAKGALGRTGTGLLGASTLYNDVICEAWRGVKYLRQSSQEGPASFDGSGDSAVTTEGILRFASDVAFLERESASSSTVVTLLDSVTEAMVQPCLTLRYARSGHPHVGRRVRGLRLGRLPICRRPRLRVAMDCLLVPKSDSARRIRIGLSRVVSTTVADRR
jgi:hypothetical protein